METKKDVIWMHPELDIEELYRTGQFEKLIQVANDNVYQSNRRKPTSFKWWDEFEHLNLFTPPSH